MLVSDIITQVIKFTDNIPPTDADYADRRERLLNYLNEVLAEVWYAREWPFARKTDTLTVTAPNGFAVLGSDFLRLGDYGGVQLAEIQEYEPLENVPEYRVIQARNTTLKTNRPRIFSIFGIDSATGNPLIQFPFNDQNFDVFVSYVKKAPTIDETTNNSALDQNFPLAYHQRVLVPGLQARTLESKGDASWNNYYGRFQAALNEMRAQERRRQGSIWQLPSFFGSRRFTRA